MFIKRCPNCKKIIEIPDNSVTNCPECGALLNFSNDSDKLNDNISLQNQKSEFEAQEINVKYEQYINEGETMLANEHFEKGLNLFQKATQIDNSNYKGWLGIIKCKTKNLTVFNYDNLFTTELRKALSVANENEQKIIKHTLQPMKVFLENLTEKFKLENQNFHSKKQQV